MPSIGPMEIAIVLIIALVVFGPKKLPELGKGLGNGMREFKSSISGEDDHSGGEPRRPLEAVAVESAEEPVAKAG